MRTFLRILVHTECTMVGNIRVTTTQVRLSARRRGNFCERVACSLLEPPITDLRSGTSSRSMTVAPAAANIVQRPSGPPPRGYRNWDAEAGVWRNDVGEAAATAKERQAKAARDRRERRKFEQQARGSRLASHDDMTSCNDSDDESASRSTAVSCLLRQWHLRPTVCGAASAAGSN